MTGPSVLVTDAGERSALAAIRALQAAGFRPTAAAYERPAAGHLSRAAARRVLLPDPRASSEAFAEALALELARHPHAIVLPGSDAALLALSEHRDKLEDRTALGLPDHATVLACLDKPTMLAAAAMAGLAGPESRTVATPAALVATAEALGYPVVLKPQRSVVDEGGSWRQQTARLVRDEPALVAEAAAFAYPLTLQAAWTDATVVSFCGVIDDGELVATACARYRRTWPVAAGSAAFATTEVAPDGLAEQAQALLAGLGWRGIFELELLARPSGVLGAIDLNPRVYGSLALARAAGANLPAVWCSRLLGARGPRVTARPGMRYRFEEADARHALWIARHGDPLGAARILRPRRDTVHAVAALTDPLPLLARPVSLGLRLVRRGARG